MTRQRSVHYYEPQDIVGLAFDPVLDDLLRNEPVARIRLPYGEGEAWLVTRYHDVKFVTSDPRFSRAAVPGRPVPKMTKHFVPLDRAVSYSDPPEHARVRKVVAKPFSQAGVERLRPLAQRTAHNLVDALVAGGRPGELVRQVLHPFPTMMIGTVLGVPASDWPQMSSWAETLLSVAADQEAADRAQAIKAQAGEYFRGLARQRRERPCEDLISVLVAAVDDGALVEEELLALVSLMQFNGGHTVRTNTSTMVYTLLTRPHLWARLRTEPEVLPRAVEELLRFVPHKSGVGQPRIATEDVEVGGVLIRSGEVVYVSYVTANWDSTVYPNPEQVDFDRPEVPHLAFGHGPHYCMGPGLARMEAQVLLSTLVQRLPELRLAVPAEQLPWLSRSLVRGLVEIPVTW
ncbi:cytochrome P450 [Amycolatopsis anabasis]|uniref:cytochrome P450 n=1 Tax=Amycolatopsis anabasis TaxID=1840409 RepID=UPI00131CE597|nr:cytochrome P450 [Amycolatopsis anabasis]